MSPLIFWLLALMALACALVAAFFFWRSRQNRPDLPSTNEMINMRVEKKPDGTSHAQVEGAALPPKPLHERLRNNPAVHRISRPPMMLAALLVLVLVGLGLWQLPSYLRTRHTNQFVVAVAAFADTDGGVGQTGRSVADELVRTLGASEGLLVEPIDEVPTNADEAYALARRYDADLLVWGQVRPGGVLDQESLLPMLAYAPSGQYAPHAWDGYSDRFVLPRSFTLATAPLNGRVLLPPVIEALRNYGNGNADLADASLGTLAANYPALAPALPATIRANVLWARGAYDQAAEQYRRALAAPADDAARIANNLAAVLLDAESGEALSALEQATQLVGDDDLAALRYNFALLALQQGRAEEALAGLAVARDLLGSTGQQARVPLLITYARAARESGDLALAAALLEDSRGRLDSDAAIVPNELRQGLRVGLRAIYNEERGMLELARAVGSTGPLLWQLETSDPLEPARLTDARSALEDASEASDVVAESWQQIETSQAANGRTGASIIANGQARRAEREGSRRRMLLAMTQIEQGRAEAPRSRGLLSRLWSSVSNGGTTLDVARQTLERQVQLEPGNRLALALYGRALRLQQQYAQADQQYNALIALDTLRPEGYAGRGVVARDQGAVDQARALLGQSLDVSQGNYFPARLALAQIAIDRSEWPLAIDQLRWLVENRDTPRYRLLLAQSLRRSGPSGFTQARETLLPLVDSAPPLADALVELGRIYNDAGQRDDAITTYREALAADARSSPAAFELGQLLAASGQLEEAAQSLRAAIDSNPNNADARLTLAEVYAAQGKADASAEMYRSAVSEGITDVRTLTNLGDRLLVQGKPDVAADAYRRALEQRPDDRELHLGLARAYLAQNDLDPARLEAQRAVELAGGTYPQALVVLGDVERQAGQLEQATVLYGQALSQDSTLVDATLGLGQVAATQGNWAVALNQYQAAAQRAPQDPMVQFWLGEALLRQNQLEASLAAYNRAIELRAGQPFPEALLGRAHVYAAAGDRTAAQSSIEEALRQRPVYAEALLFAGKLDQQLGETDQALSRYSAAISANKSLAEPYYRRALIEIQRNDLGNATSDLRRAIELQPNFPESHYWLGRTYYAEDQIDAALQSFQTAIVQAGSYPEALLYQGLAQQRKGDNAAAIGSFQAVIQANPNGEWASKAQQELNRLQASSP